ncbi:MAG: transpeptidase family protein [Paludibacteraceae bacterium]|nr:transpeptidase family protein [Paludibacteraceae bacterium]
MKVVFYILVGLLVILAIAIFYADRRSNRDLPHANIMLRYTIVCGLIAVFMLSILTKIVELQFVEGDRLRSMSGHSLGDTDTIRAKRGNILSEDGHMMAGGISVYRVYLDMRSEALHIIPKKEEKINFELNVKALSDSLALLLGDKPAAFYEKGLRKAFKDKKAQYKLHDGELSYVDFQRLWHNFPLINKNTAIFVKRVKRTKPYDQMASRTIGDIYGIETKGGKCGLELYYNDYLKGQDGLEATVKLAGKRHHQTLQPAIDGYDVVTTINIDIQEEMHQALLEAVSSSDADLGVAILMESATGKIRAISNLGKGSKGYYEKSNYAFASEIEPGSTFKTLSMMVALQDGYIDTTTRVDTRDGSYKFSDRTMKDHNYKGPNGGGGYGVATVPQLFYQSSNVGVSRIIFDHYNSNRQKYIDGIRATGFGTPMELEIPGSGQVGIKDLSDFSETTLPWMSIGYEVTVPPIYMLTFYNAIANNGTMMRPMLVDRIVNKGQVIEQYEPTVVKEQICSKTTLGKIRAMLEGVVTQGTAKPVASPLFGIAGKTGTSQITNDQGRYKDENGMAMHQITFCGYFPADVPQYSCLVYIKNPKQGPRSAGRLCGGVFKRVAETTYILNSGPETPDSEHEKALKALWNDVVKSEKAEVDQEDYQSRMPDVKGKTLQEAVYILENNGWNVSAEGIGRVYSQEPAAGVERQRLGEQAKLTLK